MLHDVLLVVEDVDVLVLSIDLAGKMLGNLKTVLFDKL
jgi:hypothetical protein